MAINYVPLNKKTHKDLKVVPKINFDMVNKNHLAAASIREYAQLCSAMPIVFIEDPQSKNVHSVVMLGLEQGQNLFWADESWQCPYVPMNIQRYPFDIRPEGDKLTLFIDENSDLISDEGEALFKEDGEPTEFMQHRQNYMAELANSEIQNQRFVKQLQELELLEEIALKVSYKDGSVRNVTGILTINEKKLVELDDEKVLAMHKAGFLGAAYSTMLSLGQLNRLVELSNKTDNPVQALQIAQGNGEGEQQPAAEEQPAQNDE